MADIATINVVVVLIDVLMPVVALTIWLALKRARVAGPSGLWLALPLAFALCWGAAWSWLPPLAALRLQPPPFGQAGAILLLVAMLVGLLALPAVRSFFRAADPLPLVIIGRWRVIYGSALLVIGLSSGLPPAFFWSVALGDIAVGLWAERINQRGQLTSEREITLWNLVGFADLAHALVLGAVHLRPFFLASPEIPPINLLPLAGVPMLIALHALTLWGLAARRMSGALTRPA